MTQKKPMRRWMKSVLTEAKSCDAQLPWARGNRKPLDARRAEARPARMRLVAQ